MTCGNGGILCCNNIDLAEICITSKAEINFDDQVDVSVLTKKALGDK